jgi:C-terminal processing protease CtpA/Prc
MVIYFYATIKPQAQTSNQNTEAAGIVNESKSEKLRLLRLQTMADIWGKLYVAHPLAFSTNLDFDNILLTAIPAIESANTTEEFVKALNKYLLEPLGDPISFAQIVNLQSERFIEEHRPAELKRISDSFVILNATDQRAYTEANIINQINDLLKTIKKQDTLIVDLRWKAAELLDYNIPGVWLRLFANKTLAAGFKVSRQHVQWSDFIPNPESSVWGSNHQTFKIEPSNNLEPIKTSKNEPGWLEVFEPFDFDSLVTINNQVYFIVNNTSYPELAHTMDALQGQENIKIIWEKTGNFINYHFNNYPENIRVNLDCNMLVSRIGYPGVHPSFLFDSFSSDKQITDIIRKGSSTQKRINDKNPFTYNINPPIGQKYSSTITKEQRIAGLMKLWMVIRYFSPHLENASMDWEKMLFEWIPRIEKDETMTEYLSSLRLIIAGLNDSHVAVWHKDWSNYTGDYLPPVRLQKVQGKVIVYELKGDSLKDIEVGDEITSIDNISTDSIENYWKMRYSASSSQAFERWLWNSPLAAATRGKNSSTITLGYINKGLNNNITLTRNVKNPWTSNDEYLCKRLENNIGYIRHYAISSEQVRDSIFDAFTDTEGMIIDLRGRPRFDIFSLATYLSTKPVAREKFEMPTVGFIYGQVLKGIISVPTDSLMPNAKHQYNKPVIALIDANMQSHSESAAMILRNTGRVTMIGSPTTGTTGNAIPIGLPNGINISFTSMKVMNTDGTKFQNIGVVPDVLVKPTIEGIKAGRDEVLEKAVEYMKSNLLK